MPLPRLPGTASGQRGSGPAPPRGRAALGGWQRRLRVRGPKRLRSGRRRDGQADGQTVSELGYSGGERGKVSLGAAAVILPFCV